MKKKEIEILGIRKIKSLRTKNIIKHIVVSFFFKGGAIAANFLLVPITIGYLNTENYGIWLTISSFIGWFSFFDIGLGNGLRNKFAKARANENLVLARAYISSAYYTVASISLLLFLLFFSLNYFIDWTTIFNTGKELKYDLGVLMPIIVGFFCLQLVVKLITSIYLADQNHSIQVKIHFVTQVLSLVIVWLLTKITGSSLLLFGTIFSALPVLILLGLNIIAFSDKYKNLKPKFSFWKKKYLKDIMGVGFEFFIIQIAVLILFSTDNFIISKLFTPKEVVPYNISFKFFSILTTIYTIIVAPYWSSFTEAYEKKEYLWIKSSVKNIMKIWLLIPLLLVIMVLISNWFYKIWVGNEIIIPFSLSISMAIFVLLFTFNMVFTYFINGVGKIRLQLITAIISIIINIPLSILFARTLHLGTSGVILATSVSFLFYGMLRPIQYYKIINNKAKGIWNK